MVQRHSLKATVDHNKMPQILPPSVHVYPSWPLMDRVSLPLGGIWPCAWLWLMAFQQKQRGYSSKLSEASHISTHHPVSTVATGRASMDNWWPFSSGSRGRRVGTPEPQLNCVKHSHSTKPEQNPRRPTDT